MYAILQDGELAFKLKGREVSVEELREGCFFEPKKHKTRGSEISATDVRRIRDLPEPERKPFRQWLTHMTRPVIDCEPFDDEHQDGYYLCDYDRWRSGLPPTD